MVTQEISFLLPRLFVSLLCLVTFLKRFCKVWDPAVCGSGGLCALSLLLSWWLDRDVCDPVSHLSFTQRLLNSLRLQLCLGLHFLPHEISGFCYFLHVYTDLHMCMALCVPRYVRTLKSILGHFIPQVFLPAPALYVCIYMYVSVCGHICVYILCVCVYVCISCVTVYVIMCVCTCACVYVYIMCLYVWMLHMCTHVYCVCVYTCVHVCADVLCACGCIVCMHVFVCACVYTCVIYM